MKKVSRNTKITQDIHSFISKSVTDNANGPWRAFTESQMLLIGGTEQKKRYANFFGTYDFHTDILPWPNFTSIPGKTQ